MLSGNDGILQVAQQGSALLRSQREECAIQQHIPRSLLAAAQDQFCAALALFFPSGMVMAPSSS